MAGTITAAIDPTKQNQDGDTKTGPPPTSISPDNQLI